MILSQLSFINNPKVRVALAVAVLFAAVIIYYLSVIRQPEAPPAPPPPPSPFITMQTAQDIAFAEARKWHDDAKLASVVTRGGEMDEQGRSTFYRFWFSSAIAPGEALEVDVRERAVVGHRVLQMEITGGDIPERGLMTEQEAMAYLRALRGYENEEVLDAELLYDEPNNMWYWGLRTAEKGVVSIEAER